MKTREQGNVYETDIAFVLQRINENLDVFVKQYPHVSQGYHYQPESNCLWTSSFFIGMCYLAYEVTGDANYIRHEAAYLESFKDRIMNRKDISHDLGFLYTLSCVADFKTTGNKEAALVAREAGKVLAERYNDLGHYIQALMAIRGRWIIISLLRCIIMDCSMLQQWIRSSLSIVSG